MIKIKHVMDTVEADDGRRLWVEPFGLTRDLCEWCHVHGMLTALGPPRELRQWFEEHADSDAYHYFRGRYHEHLANGPYREALLELAGSAVRAGITLLHQGDDPRRNTATALYEYLSELQAYCPPRAE